MKLDHLIGKTEYEEAEDWREAARTLIKNPKVALYASPSFESVQFRDAKAGGTIAAQDRMKVKMFEKDKKVAFEIIRRDETSENLLVAAINELLNYEAVEVSESSELYNDGKLNLNRISSTDRLKSALEELGYTVTKTMKDTVTKEHVKSTKLLFPVGFVRACFDASDITEVRVVDDNTHNIRTLGRKPRGKRDDNDTCYMYNVSVSPESTNVSKAFILWHCSSIEPTASRGRTGITVSN